MMRSTANSLGTVAGLCCMGVICSCAASVPADVLGAIELVGKLFESCEASACGWKDGGR